MYLPCMKRQRGILAPHGHLEVFEMAPRPAGGARRDLRGLWAAL